jgi:hypothetical protein
MPGLLSTWEHRPEGTGVEALHPIAVGLLGAQAVVLQAHDIAHLLEELFFLADGRVGLYEGVYGFGFYRFPFPEASPE